MHRTSSCPDTGTFFFAPVLRIGALRVRGGSNDLAPVLAPLGTLEWHAHADALAARVASHALDAVIVPLADESGRSLGSTIATIAGLAPQVSIIVRDQLNGTTVSQLMAVFTTGLRMEFAVRPYQALDALLVRMQSDTYRPGVAPVLLQRFVPVASASLKVFVALAAITAPERRSVEEISAWCGVSTRTIERRLLRAQWPPAHVILQSCSALDAVWLMSEYSWSARRVKNVRSFSHASSVTRLLKVYCGMLPSTLRESGGFPAALEHVARALPSLSVR
ncbi:MAG: Helix-turn-helix, AraC protein [Gemmatimonadetes bacterium]|nr:Helix-turn-helix, AraC protein [Gemmatimonadota bacterium]